MIHQRFTRPRAVVVILGAIAIAIAIASCTLLGSRDLVQCATDGDCRDSKASAPNNPAVCVDQLCQRRAADGGPVIDPEGGPDVILDSSIPDTAGDCVLRIDCKKPDHLCVDRKCQPLIDAKGGICQVLNTASPPAYLQEGAPIIGIYTFSPLSGLPWVKAADKALEEINLVLPKERRITAVFCNKRERIGFTSAQNTIDFLAKLKVPLVLGQFEASELGVINPKGLAVWSTLGNLPALQQGSSDAGSPDGGGPSKDGGVPFRFLVDEIQNLTPAFEAALDEAAIRADKITGATLAETIKIAIVRNEQLENKFLANRLETEIARLGATQSQPVEAGTIESSFEAPAAPNNATLIGQLKNNQPDVIIALGGDEIAGLIQSLETPGGGGWLVTTPRPVWVVGTRAKFSVNILAALTQTTLRARIIGVDLSGDRPNHDAYRGKLPTVLHAGSFDHIYDAVYAFAFASERAHFNRPAGAPPPGAAELTRAFDEVFQPFGSAGADVSSAGEFTKGVNAIGGGLTISFSGGTGPFVFSTEGGRTRRMGQSYFCFKRGTGPSGGNELEYYLDAAGLMDPTRCIRP